MIKTLSSLALTAWFICVCACTNVASEVQIEAHGSVDLVIKASEATIKNLGPGPLDMQAFIDGQPQGEPTPLLSGQSWEHQGRGLRVRVRNDSAETVTVSVDLRGAVDGNTSFTVMPAKGGASVGSPAEPTEGATPTSR